MGNLIEGHLHLALLAELLPGGPVLRLLPEFREHYPRIRFSVSFTSAERIHEDLIADRLSFGVLDRPGAGEFTEALNCGVLEYTAVASRGYCQQHGPFERADQILLADLVDLGPDMPLVSNWIGASEPGLRGALGNVQPAFSVPNFQAALEIVAAGAGVAFLPRVLAQSRLEAGELVELMTPGRLPARPLQLLYRKRSARPLVESLFLEHVIDRLPLIETVGPGQAA